MQLHGFQKKAIDSRSSLGALLKTARRKKKASLREAEEETKIRAHYLEAMENDDYSSIPLSHRKGFIRRYAQYLDVPQDVVNDEFGVITALSTKDIFSPSMFGKESRWVITPKLMLSIFGVLLLLAFVGYMAYQIKQFAAPPLLTISKPKSESVVTTDTITLVGQTDPGDLLYIDNLQVTPKGDGSFSYPLVLRPGLNKISVKSANSIKKESVVTLSVLYQAPPGSSPSPSPTSSPSPRPSLSPSPR